MAAPVLSSKSFSETTPYFIEDLGKENKEDVERHLKGLSPKDRYMRFTYQISEDALQAYINRIFDFAPEISYVFGAYVRTSEEEKPRLVGLAHWTFEQEYKNAEISLSVDALYRRMGIGVSLMEKALQHTKERGYPRLRVMTLPENDSMCKLAQKMGASMQLNRLDEMEGYIPLRA